ncbi:MAG TPA: zinc ABC transporter substrate-binding protein, partial [Blastocatellia bacterium]
MPKRSFEGWADRLTKAAGYGGARIVASKSVKAPPGGEHGRYDPHGWQKVANVRIYVANIRDALAAVDAVRAAEYERRATDYLKQLDGLEAEIRHLRARDSSLLRHGHWSLSQVATTEASEREWVQLVFSFEQQPNENTRAKDEGDEQHSRLDFRVLAGPPSPSSPKKRKNRLA